MSRAVRLAPAEAVFNARAIRVTTSGALTPGPWFRLGQTAYPDPFYANPASRFTPSSLAFPCVYLAADKGTTVAEVYGDRMAPAQAANAGIFTIPPAIAASYTYSVVATLPGDLRICDLTDAETLQNTGLDLSTYHLPDVRVPLLWAERIANHPAKFDGVHYRSRHTDQPCVALWIRPLPVRELRADLLFKPAGPFLHSPEAYAAALARGLKLAFLT